MNINGVLYLVKMGNSRADFSNVNVRYCVYTLGLLVSSAKNICKRFGRNVAPDLDPSLFWQHL